ncbi:hypothetical protein LCGC14_0800380 [marine sediment metagenome]|uniref:Uncharacterized protein n=1 Tax=marine sediment metagenome TaxID=412755 RepID=A0A0F9PUD8_9ZZZZ
MAEQVADAGVAGGEQKNDQLVPWSRFNGVMNENKELKGSIEAMRGEVDTLKETVVGLQSAPDKGGAADIYGDPDRYVSDRVKVGVDEAMAAKDAESREAQRKTNEAAAIDLLHATPEWRADSHAADKDYGAVLKEMRTNPAEYARAAILLFNDMRKGKGDAGESVREDNNGNRRVKKEAVLSMKGKGAGNGGYTRGQIAAMSTEEFLKNKDAIIKAGQDGLISDD